jgi:ATP-dependent DNA helicase PIF1
LKKGAQVMLIFNLDIEAGLVNGSRGIVAGFIESGDKLPNGKRIERKFPVVKFKNGVVRTMYYNSWDNLEHIGLSVSQIPLTLSFCNTIHKMQGQTTDIIDVDIGSGIFECGQTYVALSRVKTLEGLFISDFEPDKIKVHPKVKEYYQKLVG